MAQRDILLIEAGHQAFAPLIAADVPDLTADYDAAGAAAAAQSAAISAAATDATTKANAAQAAAIAASLGATAAAGGDLAGNYPNPTVQDDSHAHTGATLPGLAPTDADYLVGTAQGGLSAEIVVGTSPGGELGGSWAAPTVDATHSGSSHAGVISAHEAAGDPHPGYLTPAEGNAAYDAAGAAAAAQSAAIAAAATDATTKANAAAAASIAKTFLDAKGDLISASANDTPAILPAGADDTILMADAAAASGLKWVAAATPSTQAFGDAAAAGTADTFTRGDHKHGMPASPTPSFLSIAKWGV